MQLSIDDFLKLRAQLPIVDVRSEGEYQQGHIPAALNIPILNNTERIAVGTDYKQKGQQEAIKTGFRLVGPRLIDIVSETEKIGKEILVHCWRGGMRSSNFCQFVGMARVKSHQLAGGYKAYRAKALESYKLPMQLTIISGCTGSGKSEILRALKNQGEQIIDLEQLASHKGSAFGGLMLPPQPTTEQFQNDLFEEIHKLDLSRRVWIEDESIAVGKIFLPEGLWRQMNSGPVIEIEVDKAVRIERLVQEYGAADKDMFLQAMIQITKKLGGQHFNAAREKLLQDDMAAVIAILLTYYDKAYTNGLIRKKQRVKTSVSWNGNDADAFAATLIQQAK
ncbi:tRNA 2-selenouridine(34) synthase MnmH [Ohtaekwangia kribbensis]|jgi:tRNA 2-selenouridine synthase|uniref:tRNA 2-selenouridine(34) synthase MnmH n=1 Tax=Ohtaekwangia kribbensis TaxID=688913 RepID=A0ABW3K3U0_9BACT